MAANAQEMRNVTAPVLTGLAAVTFACFVLHSAQHVMTGETSNVLWACNMASLWVAVGIALRRAWLVASGLLWLSLGTPLWIVYLIGGGEFFATSVGIHVLTPVCAVLALRQLGWPRRVWLRALGLLVLLTISTRFVTEPQLNVNLAFRVWEGWERTFPDHRVYLVLIGALHVSVFALLDLVGPRWFSAQSSTL